MEFSGDFAKGNLKSIARLANGIERVLSRESQRSNKNVTTDLQQVSEGANREIRNANEDDRK
jgi:hypothetical protein